MVLQDYKIDGDYISISKKELNALAEHYYYCASLDSNEAVHRAFYLGKEAVIIDILRMFEPLEE